jgi:hypothetical protein
MRFGNVPVLAKEAAHVAAGGSHAKYASTGQKMIQRFFFDWVDLQRSGRTIAQAVEFTATVDSDKTEAALPIANVAMPRTQVAMNAAVCFGLPPLRFVQRGGLGKDWQSGHRSSRQLFYSIL